MEVPKTLRPALLITRLVLPSAVASYFTFSYVFVPILNSDDAELYGYGSLAGLVPYENPLLLFGKLGKDLISST